MTFFSVRRIKGRQYVYEMESYRNEDGQPRNRVVRYVGAVDPVYGRPAVDVAQLRAQAKKEATLDRSPQQRRLDLEETREEARVERDLRARRW